MVAVTHVEPLTGFKLRLGFDDGSERVVDLSDTLWGPMAEPLRDPEYFRRVRVDAELRTIVWPNGFDLTLTPTRRPCASSTTGPDSHQRPLLAVSLFRSPTAQKRPTRGGRSGLCGRHQQRR